MSRKEVDYDTAGKYSRKVMVVIQYGCGKKTLAKLNKGRLGARRTAQLYRCILSGRFIIGHQHNGALGYSYSCKWEVAKPFTCRAKSPLALS